MQKHQSHGLDMASPRTCQNQALPSLPGVFWDSAAQRLQHQKAQAGLLPTQPTPASTPCMLTEHPRGTSAMGLCLRAP